MCIQVYKQTFIIILLLFIYIYLLVMACTCVLFLIGTQTCIIFRANTPWKLKKLIEIINMQKIYEYPHNIIMFTSYEFKKDNYVTVVKYTLCII